MIWYSKEFIFTRIRLRLCVMDWLWISIWSIWIYRRQALMIKVQDLFQICLILMKLSIFWYFPGIKLEVMERFDLQSPFAQISIFLFLMEVLTILGFIKAKKLQLSFLRCLNKTSISFTLTFRFAISKKNMRFTWIKVYDKITQF